MDDNALHERLLAAHEARDIPELVVLYTEAALLDSSQRDIDTMCFYLTQAWVHALQCNHGTLEQLHDQLNRLGRL